MSYITEFEVAGLVGRRGLYREKLNRDVNVFFGVNGSGKTSLLKILHAAMLNETRPILGIAFTTATVGIFADQDRREYRSSLKKPKDVAERFEAEFAADALRWHPDVIRHGLLLREDAAWSVKPERKGQQRGWAHRYLPTSRLYAGADLAAGRNRDIRERIPSEEELETVLAEFLDRLWASYSARILGAAKRIQESGLNNILRSVLARRPAKLGSELNPEEAYRRAVSFLGDTAGKLLGTAEEFQRRFAEDPHMQIVIAQITNIDEQVEQLTVPRNRLQDLIKDMFAGPKEVTFTDNAIDVRSPERTPIRLASLSSGEKQLLRILLETMSAGESSIIIDEPEISMHVDWQKRLVAAMRQLNPKCQIIMATHSPEIMAELEDDKIFRL
jgi:energy-coupling factor transporter ATP-binding protein EcfA2